MDKILRIYTNELYQLLIESGLGINNFQSKDDQGYVTTKYGLWGNEGKFCPAFKVGLKKNSMYFEIIQSNWSAHRFHCYFYTDITAARIFNPSWIPFTSTRGPSSSQTWHRFSAIKRFFLFWLDTHVRDYLNDQKVTDLWVDAGKVFELGASRSPLGNTFSFDAVDNSELSQAEINGIKSAVNKLLVHIVERHNPTTEQLRIISSRLSHVISLTEKLGRFDWKNMLLSTLIGIALNLSIDTASAKLFYGFFSEAATEFGLLSWLR